MHTVGAVPRLLDSGTPNVKQLKSDTWVLQHSKGIAIFATAKTRRTLFVLPCGVPRPLVIARGFFVRIKIYLLFLSLYYPDMSTGNPGIICLSLYTAFGSRAAWFICLCKTSGLDLLKPIPLMFTLQR